MPEQIKTKQIKTKQIKTREIKIRINADDFGISPGVNRAIEQMFQKQKLHSASLICGCDHFNEAILIAKNNPDLKVGLHFNLSSGFSALGDSQLPLLTYPDGVFKNGFVKLFLLAIFKREQLLPEIARELEAQISSIESSGIKLNHIDSHRHIHFIPGIFNIVVEAAKKHNIKTVRVINESLPATWKISYKKSFLFDGGVIKWLILRLCGLFNNSKNFPAEYFFSILYTCKVSDNLIKKIIVPQGFAGLEIMIHPGDPDIDGQIANLEEKAHLLSKNRYLETLSR